MIQALITKAEIQSKSARLKTRESSEKSESIEKSRSSVLASIEQALNPRTNPWIPVAAVVGSFLVGPFVLGGASVHNGAAASTNPELQIEIEKGLKRIQKNIDQEGAIATELQHEGELIRRTLQDLEIFQKPIVLLLEDSRRNEGGCLENERLSIQDAQAESLEVQAAGETTIDQGTELYKNTHQQLARLLKKQRILQEDNERLEQLRLQLAADVTRLVQKREEARRLLSEQYRKSVWQIINDWRNWILNF